MMDYRAYLDLGGTLDEGSFNVAYPTAKAHVDHVIGYKHVPEEHQAAYDAAVASTCDAVAECGDFDAASFSIGGFSMTSGQTPWRAKADSRIRELLFPTGLLNAGVRVG